MPKVPELNGLMVAPAGARQGNFQYSQVNPDQTVSKALADVDEKAFALMGLQAKKARDDMIDARATEFANQYFRFGTELTVGKDGALRQTGAAVIQPKDGIPFTVAYGEKLDQRESEILAGISDPELRKKTEDKIRTMSKSFMAQLINHEGAENHNYIVSQAKAGVVVDTERLRAEGVTKDGLARLRGSVLRRATVEGLNTKDPVIAEAAVTEARALASGAVKEQIYGQLDRGDIAGAERAYAVASSEDALTLDDRVTMQKLIGGAKDARLISSAAGQARYDITTSRSPSHVAAAAVFGTSGLPEELAAELGVQVPPGASGNSMLARSAQAKALTVLADRFGSMEAAITAATIGVDRMEQAIAEGGAGGWAEALTPTERGQATRAVNKYSRDVGLRMAPTEAEIMAALAGRVPDRLMADAVEEVKSGLAMEDMRRQAEQLNAVNQAVDLISQGVGFDGLPASVRFGMTPEQQRAARVLASRDPRKPVVGNSAERMRLENNPELLRDMSDADFAIVVRSWTTDEEYAALAARRNALLGMNNVNTDVNRSDVTYAADAYGRRKYEDWDDSTPEAKYRRARVHDEAIRRAGEAARQNVGVGGATKGLTPEVIDTVVRSVFDSRLTTTSGWFTSASSVPWYEMKLDDFTSGVRGVGRILAVGMFNEKEPSDNMVKETIVRFAYDPPKDMSSDAMDQIRRAYGDELDAIQSEFEAARGMKLSDSALVRAFILKSQNDTQWDALLGKDKNPKAGATRARYNGAGASTDDYGFDGLDY